MSLKNISYPQLDELKSTEEIEDIRNLRISQVQTNNLFHKPYFKIYNWNDEYTTEKYIRLLNTYSNFQILSKNIRDVLKN